MLLILLGAGVALEASTFDVGFLTDPVGPKALPYLVALILIATGAHAWFWPPAEVTRPAPAARSRIAAALVGFVVYSVTLPYVGFFVCTTGVVAVLSRLYGAPWTRGLAAASVLSAVIWLIFVQLLALPLPIGSLWIR